MARTASDIVIDAEPSQIMDVIADFEAYPSWAKGVKSAEVVQAGEQDTRPRVVHFVLDATPIRDQYDLLYSWDSDSSVSWSLCEPATILTAVDGRYDLVPEGSGTKVTYRLTVDVSVPLLGMLKRKAEKVIIDTALSGLKRQVEQVG